MKQALTDSLPHETSKRYSAATVHEAAGKQGALSARIRPAFPDALLWGPAFPIECPVSDNLWLHRGIYEAGVGDILVVATTAGDEYGYWGEILSEAANARHLGGIVIDGGVRDVEALRKIGFPVFSAYVSIRGTTKNRGFRGGGLREAVSLDGITVRRGDLVVGDADGVVIVAEEDSETVLHKAQLRDASERELIAKIRGGSTTLELLNLPGESSAGGQMAGA